MTSADETPLAEELGRIIDAKLTEGSTGGERVTWPCERWRDDPVGFARDVLGRELTIQQCEIAEAVVGYPRVAVRASQKVGKSDVAACLALWWYATRPLAKVVLIAPTDRQVNKVLWEAIRLRVRDARAQGYDLGEPAQLAHTGLCSDDFRSIHGVTAKHPEALAGTSGANLLYICDEASGIDDQLFEAMIGNTAAGDSTRMLLISNPTKSYGFFAECFFEKQEHWRLLHLSSLQSPNYLAGKRVVPGLATREWVEDRKREYGETSVFFRVRCLGEFCRSEAGQIIPLSLIAAAQERWHDALDDGELRIGIDPAGPSSDGDETAIAVVRGKKLLEIHCWRGLTIDGIAEMLRHTLHRHRRNGEKPRVTLDATGNIGELMRKQLWGMQGPDNFTFRYLRVNEPCKNFNEKLRFDRVRDKAYWDLYDWLRPEAEGGQGGCIPPDAKLERELNAAAWVPFGNRGVVKATPKEELRTMLGRSPDRADALMMAIAAGPVVAGAAPARTDDYRPTEQVFDPYGEQRGIDVYGGFVHTGVASDSSDFELPPEYR